MTTTSYNRKSPAVKRILQEAKELQEDPSVEYTARPLDENIFEWHFTVSGPVDTEFDGGRYHGRILLPNEYPFKPPEVLFLTPNGRFELNKKICLSITGFHPEYWQPAWGVRTVMLGIMGFFPTKAEGAIGGIDYQPDERKKLARSSRVWTCTACQSSNLELLPDIPKANVHTQSRDIGDMPQFSFSYAENKPVKSDLAVNENNNNTSTTQEQPQSGNESICSNMNETPVTSRGSELNGDTGSDKTPRLASAQGLTMSGQDQARTAGDSSQQPHPNSNLSPRWLDGLIMGLVAILIGLVIRKIF
ncbi:non-canonical ubiquitin conjugating enzyme 1 [Umbelopsis sp. PMI_123]|nr:non-canonical ubiquitin conjugating enzyme 1 [Umbelopsis sp. PMI_123]